MRPAWDIFFPLPHVVGGVLQHTWYTAHFTRVARRGRSFADGGGLKRISPEIWCFVYSPSSSSCCCSERCCCFLTLRKRRDIFSADGWFNNIIYYSVSVVFSAGFIILFLDSLFLKHNVCRAPSDSGDYRWSFKDLDVFYDSILSTKCYATIVQGHLNCGSYAISAESHELHSCNILHRCINYFFL